MMVKQYQKAHQAEMAQLDKPFRRFSKRVRNIADALKKHGKKHTFMDIEHSLTNQEREEYAHYIKAFAQENPQFTHEGTLRNHRIQEKSFDSQKTARENNMKDMGRLAVMAKILESNRQQG